MTAGEKVRALRKALGLTQAQLADRSGGSVVQGEVAKVESGRNKLTSFDLRANLAHALGLPLDSFRAYLDGEIELRTALTQAGQPKVAGKAAGAPRPELRIEPDPTPHLETSGLSTPLERAIGHAFDPKRHDWADGQDVLQALQRGIHGHDRPEVDLIEAARRWLDAAHDLRREGTPVTATSLLDRITFGKSPMLRGGGDSASEAMQREMIEHGERDGVTFGEGAAAIEAFRLGGKPAARDVDQAERELGKRAGEGIDETSGKKGGRE